MVFLGYSLNDPNIQFIYHEVLFDQKSLGELTENESFSQFRPSFFVTERPATEQDKAYYRHKRIRYVDGYPIERFFQELTEAFERDQTRRADVTAAIRQDIVHYQPLYDQLDWNTDPNALQFPDEGKRDYVARLLTLVELYEVVYRKVSPSQPVLTEFDPIKMSGVVQGALRVLEEWCRQFLLQGRTEILESILEFMEARLRQYRKGYFTRLLNCVGQWLNEFRAINGIGHFVRRYLVMLSEYDRGYNDWSDYTYCLEHSVRCTRLFPLMSPAQKGQVVKSLYDQLEMCGRDSGDSWYTTNRVYSVWGEFNAAAWPDLEAEIRRHMPGLNSRQCWTI